MMLHPWAYSFNQLMTTHLILGSFLPPFFISDIPCPIPSGNPITQHSILSHTCENIHLLKTYELTHFTLSETLPTGLCKICFPLFYLPTSGTPEVPGTLSPWGVCSAQSLCLEGSSPICQYANDPSHIQSNTSFSVKFPTHPTKSSKVLCPLYF
jgi:hypothetical protein